MPIYEYLCEKCGNKFEYLHKRLNEDIPSCPECGAKKIKKLFSTFNAGKENSSSITADKPPCANNCKCSTNSCPFAT